METVTKFQWRLLIVLALASFTATSPAIAQTAPIAQTVARLREIKVDPMGTDIYQVSAAAIPLLTQLKHQLRDLISETLNAKTNQPQTPRQLQAHVFARLKQEKIAVEEPEPDAVYDEKKDSQPLSVYGSIYTNSIEIRQPAHHPNLLAVTTTLGINCGEDTSLYIFKKTRGQWKLVLAQETNGYREVSGAQDRFKYALSPPDSKHDFFVVTANVNPWCTSNWQRIRYKVFRVGPTAYQPRTLLSRHATIYLGIDDPVYRLSVKANTFSLGFINDLNNDVGRLVRKQLRYAVDGNRVRKVSSRTRLER